MLLKAWKKAQGKCIPTTAWIVFPHNCLAKVSNCFQHMGGHGVELHCSFPRCPSRGRLERDGIHCLRIWKGLQERQLHLRDSPPGCSIFRRLRVLCKLPGFPPLAKQKTLLALRLWERKPFEKNLLDFTSEPGWGMKSLEGLKESPSSERLTTLGCHHLDECDR